MDVPVNLLTVGLATIAAMLVGWLWYGPLFGARWRQLAGNPVTRPAVIYPVALVANLVTAYVLAYMSQLCFVYFGGPFVLRALVTALALWLGFAASRALIVTLFDARPFGLYLINTGHNLAVSLVMAGIIGLIGV